MALFLAHTVILLALSAAAARRLARALPDQILATLGLAWANIVATCLLLAGLHALGEPAWLFRASLLLAFATWGATRFVSPPPADPESDAGKIHPRLLLACALTLLPLVWISVRVAGTYAPNNYDTLTYHLPRAMYYWGQGDLAHFDTGNPRQTYFPFNYNLLQLYFLAYAPGLQLLNFLNLLAWAASGVAIFRVSRLSGLTANAALVAAWFALTALQVFAQASATTNDLPTSAGLLAGLAFVLRWRAERLTRDALLAGLALGLAAGTKLTVVFFAPAAGLIVALLAWQHVRRGELRPFFAGVRAWIAPGIVAAVFAAPFALINLAEKHEWINKTYDFTLNRPWSFGCAWQTTRAYLVQLFLEPLHRFTFDLKITAELNEWGTRTLFPHWNPAYAFSELYPFPPDLNEDHVWFGFTGPAIFLAAVYCLIRARRFAAPIVWSAALGLGWFAAYFWLNKWSLYNQRYFVPAMLVMSPCLGAIVELAWTHERRRAWVRGALGTLAFLAVWLAAIYLFQNTSRPYAPLWENRPAPPAWPTLPGAMIDRIAAEPRVNIQSTDGNERIFLLMGQGRNQRFTSLHRTVPDAYNVFSQWGFVRKVAYSNIEQLSSYTLVEIPSKRSAGVEFLGTIGQGQPALDYYGLAPHPEAKGASATNRNVLVELHYAPREPNRYSNLRIKAAGLNAPDHARLIVGVEFTDGTSAELATFTATGEAHASVTKPLKRFTFRASDLTTGELVGSTDMPHLAREEGPDVDTPHDPFLISSDQFITASPQTRAKAEGLAAVEGPYPQWDLPVFRWAKSPVVRIEIPPHSQTGALELSFELCTHVRESALIDVVFNGEIVKHYFWEGRTRWLIQKLSLTPKPGVVNTIEFRNVAVSNEPDWKDYLERYPDVKNYLVSQNIPLEKGAQDHWEMFGKKETRTLFNQRQIERLPGTEQLYYIFRSLRVDTYRAR